MRNLTESTRSREAAHPPNEMTRIWGWVLSRRGVGLGLSLVKAVAKRIKTSSTPLPILPGAPFSRSICCLATPHNKPRSPPFRNVIFAKSLGNPSALLRCPSGAKMIHFFHRRIVSDNDRRDKEGVSLSLGSSDTRVRHAGDELVDFGGARAAGRFSSNGDPKNSSGAKPFSHGRFNTRDAGNTALSEKLSRGADRLCRAAHLQNSFSKLAHRSSLRSGSEFSQGLLVLSRVTEKNSKGKV